MEITVHRKTFAGPVELHGASGTVDGAGSFRATIARLRLADGSVVVDHEGDAYASAASFPIGKTVLVSAYGHKSWEGALPVGVATIHANQYAATAVGQFFLETAGGMDTHRTLKAMHAAGVASEWSFGFDVVDQSTDYAEVQKFAPGARRILKSLDLFEVSPVLKGAGIATQTEDIKRGQLGELDQQIAAMRQYRDFLLLVRKMRSDGHLDEDRGDQVARNAVRALLGATESLRRTA